jgi:iron(III) transport system substrate-binding protein
VTSQKIKINQKKQPKHLICLGCFHEFATIIMQTKKILASAGRKFMKKILIILFSLVFVLAGCAPTNQNPNEQSKILNVYSARHYDLDKTIIANFEAETGIKVNVISANGNELLERMIRESAQPQADLFLTVGAETLYTALNEDLFDVVDVSKDKDVLDSQYYGERWVAYTKRARVIVYNKEKYPDGVGITSYDDLVDEKWANQILVRSSTNSYNIALLASFILSNGSVQARAWAEGVVKNFARTPTGNDRAQAAAVIAGLGDLGIMNTYYLGIMINSADQAEREVAEKIGVVIPENVHVNISYAAILKNATNKANAQKFIDYLLSVENQELFMNGNGEFPVRSDVELTDLLASWGPISPAPIDYEKLGREYAAALMMFDAVKWE